MTDDRTTYVTASALAYAIEIGGRLSSGFRDEGEVEDMKRLLGRLVPSAKSRLALAGIVRMKLASIEAED